MPHDAIVVYDIRTVALTSLIQCLSFFELFELIFQDGRLDSTFYGQRSPKDCLVPCYLTGEAMIF